MNFSPVRPQFITLYPAWSYACFLSSSMLRRRMLSMLYSVLSSFSYVSFSLSLSQTSCIQIVYSSACSRCSFEKRWMFPNCGLETHISSLILSAIHRRSHMGLHIRCHHRYSSTPLPIQVQPNLIHPPGPYGANIFDPHSWGNRSNPEEINLIILEFTRVVLAVGVFAIGVELPKAYMLKHWKSLFFLLVPVMTWVRFNFFLFFFSF